ncbi:MAG: glycosyltransferase [Dehalococcoidia bacterium]|nr:glycosyltransferase [Dehalococcoidia bacterium]
MSLENYASIIGDSKINEIYAKARRLQGTRILHINSTNQGGGVAEILRSLVPLMNDAGLEADWRVLHGTPDFFEITKKFHNGLQGRAFNLSEYKKQLYVDTNRTFSSYCHIDADCVVVHDPQPLPLIKFYKKNGPWIWRCHVDLSNPAPDLWEFLKTFVIRYDMTVVSSEAYCKKCLPLEQRIIYPAIDPLSLKNRELSKGDMLKYIRKAGIPTDKPLMTQVSRMDIWKDPEGVLEVYKQVKKQVDCRLLYCYDMASDDPEGRIVLDRMRRKAKKFIESGDVLFVQGCKQVLVNAIQRFSDVLVQKSKKEGFCLTVTEALWKGKPVVGSRVGGIPHQLVEAENGFLVDPNDTKAFADRVVELLKNPKLAEQLGRRGKETVRENFLMTRLLTDYLDMLTDILPGRNGHCTACGHPLPVATAAATAAAAAV